MQEFDVVVVGGGSAGSAAAGRLAEDGKRTVCLVEAGGPNTHVFTRTPGLLALMPEKSMFKYDTEPMAGLGASESAQMIDILRGLRGEVAMLLVEHDMNAVFALADRVSVLVYGAIIASGSAAEIQADANVRAAYLGAGDA